MRYVHRIVHAILNLLACLLGGVPAAPLRLGTPAPSTSPSPFLAHASSRQVRAAIAWITAAIALTLPATSAAEICTRVNQTVAKAAAAVGVGGVSTSALVSAAPLTAVPHSSGALILTGASGYVGNTFGAVAGAWAVATAPVTVAIGAALVVVGAGTVGYCHFAAEREPSQTLPQPRQQQYKQK